MERELKLIPWSVANPQTILVCVRERERASVLCVCAHGSARPRVCVVYVCDETLNIVDSVSALRERERFKHITHRFILPCQTSYQVLHSEHELLLPTINSIS